MEGRWYPRVCESLASSCDGADFLSQEDANQSFNNNVRLTTDTTFEVTHYVFGDYWYTADLAEEFNSVSTHIHRSNARLAMTVQLLVNGMTEAQVMDYTDIIGWKGILGSGLRRCARRNRRT